MPKRTNPKNGTTVSGRLERLVSELKRNEGTDLEGDRSYRVNIKLAEHLIREAYNSGAEDERKACAEITRYGCLVPPDRGSPTESEVALCDEIVKAILSR